MDKLWLCTQAYRMVGIPNWLIVATIIPTKYTIIWLRKGFPRSQC